MTHPLATATLLSAALLVLPAIALAQDWRQDVKVVTTDTDPTVSLRGKESTDRTDTLSERTWSLVSSVDKRSKQTKTVLQFAVLYESTAWQNWRMANTADGRSMEIVSFKKALIECKGACTFYEQVAVDLPKALLDQAGAGPAQVRFRSEFGGEHLVTVEPALLSAQAAAVGATVAALP